MARSCTALPTDLKTVIWFTFVLPVFAPKATSPNSAWMWSGPITPSLMGIIKSPASDKAAARWSTSKQPPAKQVAFEK